MNGVSVHHGGSQPRMAPTPPYVELVRRLVLITEGIDFLLGNPDLKPGDKDLALLILRQTVLFGKETDKITVHQQASGVRHLNRGTGLHPKTLQRARARLRKAGFMRVLGEPGDRHGNTYSPDFQHIREELVQHKLRNPGADCSAQQSYGSNQNSATLAGS